MEEESKEYVDKIEAVDEKSITLLIQKITLRMKLRLKSRLKTMKCQKLVEDFTEYYIKVKDEPKDAFEEISGTENCMSGFRNYCTQKISLYEFKLIQLQGCQSAQTNLAKTQNQATLLICPEFRCLLLNQSLILPLT